MIAGWLWLRSILLAALLWQLAAAKSKDLTIKSMKLQAEPIWPFYFENSDTVLFQDAATGDVYRSFNGGADWDVIDDEDGTMKGNVWTVHPHPYDNNKAYIIGLNGQHWVTTDKAKTWRRFDLDAVPSLRHRPLAFHGADSKKVIFHGEKCFPFRCAEMAFYTEDDFETVHELRDHARGCFWAVGTPEFADAVPDVAEELTNRVFCIVQGLKSPFSHAYRLVSTDDYFSGDSEGVEVKLDNGRPVAGIVNAASVKKYIVAAARSQGTDEMALYVTSDAKNWQRAQFGDHKLEEDAYTILESTNYSIQVDVMNTDRVASMGVLCTSNSNGTYFTTNIEHTNRNDKGLVDFEKVSHIQGIILVNVVQNWEDVEKKGSEKKIISKISFDDGRTFHNLKVDDKNLHVHSVTAFKNIGPVFSSPAPGLVMAVGNSGDHLKEYSEGDLYVSDDAGVTWRRGLKKPHKYEFGNHGAIIVAIPDDGDPTKKVRYSINHGKDWETAELDTAIRPYYLTTTPDASSLKFLLAGLTKDNEWIVFSLDFNGLHERKCKESDFEKWPARVDDNGEPSCLMGQKQFYRRRKSDADCFVDEDFKDPVPIFEPCKCTAEDFECDYGFVRSEDGKECKPVAPLKVPEGQCKNEDDTFKGPSGWRLIPGNACIRDGGEELDKEVERPCKDAHKVPSGGADGITATKTDFKAKQIQQYFYLERAESSRGDDETIVMLTSDGELFVTHDHGKSWERQLKDVTVREIVPHRYINDRAFFLTDGEKHYLTINRGRTFDSFKAPGEGNPFGGSLSFHASAKDWLMWLAPHNCDSSFPDTCPQNAYVSKNRGDSWDLLARAVDRCEFMMREDRENSTNLIFCDQYEDENPNNRRLLVSSSDFFATSETKLTDVLNFATMEEFIIIAARDPEKKDSLKAGASVDGREFADAHFPPNLDVPVQRAYTVLESFSHSVFLHVTVHAVPEQSFGAIIKSNSNGTSYVLSLNNVNRNTNGYVDFERTRGLEGLAIANVVANPDEVKAGKESKRLRTMITHNDGAQWQLLPPPEKDADGKKYGCGPKPTEKCALHLHGFTERRDWRDTYGSASAVGFLFATGNVGDHLTERGEANTYFSRDGGITWKEVRKGNYMWEFGDQGSVLVLVPELKPTKVLHFSLDEGETWEDFEFSDTELVIEDISTVPSDSSKNFLLWGAEEKSGKVVTVNVDFGGIYDRTCELNEKGGESKDYYMWEPKHPLQEGNCLFGHVEQYHRKKPSARCWNDWTTPHVHFIAHNCTCTREDFEWYVERFTTFDLQELTSASDYNYEPQSDGSCALVPGLPKPDALAYCRENPDAIEYWEPTGYRRIPLTTCQGGLLLDQVESHPCPSHEKEYQAKHGIGPVGLFFAIVTPIGIAAAAGYYVYNRWDGKLGQIRLGETSGGGGRWEPLSVSSRDSPLINIPITIVAATVAATVAVVRVLPLLVTSLWRSARGYVRLPGRGRGPRPYATRGSFAARRGDYTVVDDEDELLGADEIDEEDES